MAGMMERFKNFLTGGEYEEDYTEYDDEMGLYEEQDSAEDSSMWTNNSYEEQTVISEPAPAVTTPVYQQPATTVVMLSPYDIRTSQIVCDHIREGHIVICNLTASSNNQRVVDYISGGVYAFDGKIEPTAVKTTFVCTPKNVNLIVDANEASESISGTKVSAL
ncbi:MAG: cell division protein SepF [Clostridiales bacterium]|nr:cell division protein SepF [Clostridiales bacterium]